MKEQLFIVYDKLKPINLIKSTFEEIGSTLAVKNSLINNLIGALTGFLTQRVIVGSKPNLFKKLAGMLLEYGVAAVVSRYADAIKTMGMQMITQFLSNKSVEEIKPSESNTKEVIH